MEADSTSKHEITGNQLEDPCDEKHNIKIIIRNTQTNLMSHRIVKSTVFRCIKKGLR